MGCPEVLRDLAKGLEVSHDDDRLYVGTFPTDLKKDKFDGRYEILVADKIVQKAYWNVSIIPAEGPVVMSRLYDYFRGGCEVLLDILAYPPIKRGDEPETLQFAFGSSFDESIRILEAAKTALMGKKDALEFIDNELDILRRVFRKRKK